jgi:hypothetical protein
MLCELMMVFLFWVYYRFLMELVERHGQQRWSLIATYLTGRIGKQCRERWHNHLRPDIKVCTMHTKLESTCLKTKREREREREREFSLQELQELNPPHWTPKNPSANDDNPHGETLMHIMMI